MLLSISVPIVSLNITSTNLPLRKSGRSSVSLLYTSTRFDTGGLISILRLNIDDIDVAAEPIIWFIASPIALR